MSLLSVDKLTLRFRGCVVTSDAGLTHYSRSIKMTTQKNEIAVPPSLLDCYGFTDKWTSQVSRHTKKVLADAKLDINLDHCNIGAAATADHFASSLCRSG